MNDAHIVALVYRVEHDEQVEYDGAAPREFETDDFKIQIANERARFEMKARYANVEEARKLVRPFIRAWQIYADIKHHPGVFRLVDHKIELINSRRNDDTVTSIATRSVETGFDLVLIRPMLKYPDPPVDFQVTPEVDSMASHFLAYRKGRETILSAANFVKDAFKKCLRDSAESPHEYFCISRNVLDKLGILASYKGGGEARKYDARDKPLTAQERTWLDAAMRAIILRVAAKAASPAATFPPITMDSLPPLS